MIFRYYMSQMKKCRENIAGKIRIRVTDIICCFIYSGRTWQPTCIEKKGMDLVCNLSGYVEEKGIEKGIQKGREEGENALGKLMDILLSKGDVTNAKFAATDEKARKELYRKYGIIEKP